MENLPWKSMEFHEVFHTGGLLGVSIKISARTIIWRILQYPGFLTFFRSVFFRSQARLSAEW